MNALLDFVASPLFAMLVILFGPLTIALIYRAWHGGGRSKRKVPAVPAPALNALVGANRLFASRFALQDLPVQPARRLAVVTCMDARLPVEQLLGLKPGDAHIIRNAGGIVTEDTIRSLLVSHYLFGTQEFLIINHTDCGMMSFTDAELNARLQRTAEKKLAMPFYAFRDLDDNVRRQVQKVKSHPWMPANVPVRGFVYDVRTGLLRELVGPSKDSHKSVWSIGHDNRS
jgi:carbonic anhydrase